ncbi:MAG: hypothetical protein ABIG11_06520, partial [bacterium]
ILHTSYLILHLLSPVPSFADPGPGFESFVPAASTAIPLPSDINERAMRAMEGIYSLHFDVSDLEFNALTVIYPDHPFGHFGKAITAWARLEYEEEESNPELDRLFQKLTDDSLVYGKKWLKTHPDDAYAHICVGGMYGLRSRLSLMQHRWIKAYFDGSKAISHTRKAVKINPELYDAYLGLGMYEYYAGTLPGVVKILARLFLHGDPEKGIAFLKTAKEKGHFNATAAKLLLIEIFTETGSKYSNPGIALKWAKELRAAYPHHPMLHFVEIVSLYENGKWADVRKESQEYLRRIETGEPFYRNTYLPRALLALGTSYLAENRLDRAEEFIRRSARSLKDSTHPNRWAVWALVRLGHIYDLTGRRDLAVKTYKEALSFKDQWGFRQYIRKYISKPCLSSEIPGQLPPP